MLIVWRHAIGKEFGSIDETVRWALGHHMLNTPLPELHGFWEVLVQASHVHGVPHLWFWEDVKVSLVFRFGSLWMTTWDEHRAINWQTACDALEMRRRLNTVRSMIMRDEKFEQSDKRMAGLPLQCTNTGPSKEPYRGAWSILFQAGLLKGSYKDADDCFEQIAEKCPVEGMKNRRRQVKLLDP